MIYNNFGMYKAYLSEVLASITNVANMGGDILEWV
jgi:hypothetical protein